MPGGDSREIAMFLCGTEKGMGSVPDVENEPLGHRAEISETGRLMPLLRERPPAVDQLSPDPHTDHFDVDADQALQDSEVHRRACACSGVPRRPSRNTRPRCAASQSPHWKA